MRKIKTFLLGICLAVACAYTVDAGPLTPDKDKEELSSVDLRAKVAVTYSSQIGVRETLGANDSPEIREYLKITNVKVPAAWCAAFVSYCYTVNGVPNPRSAWSPSYFSPAKTIDPKINVPLQADLFGVWYNNLNRIAHVGFIDSWPRDTDYFITVEGNTNDNGSREGNGVYKKRRLKRTASKVSRWIYTKQLLTNTNTPCTKSKQGYTATHPPKKLISTVRLIDLSTSNYLSYREPLRKIEYSRRAHLVEKSNCRLSTKGLKDSLNPERSTT